MRVREIMTSAVVTVTPQTRVKQAATLLVERGFTALPVVDSGKLVGIVTEADLVPLESTPDPRSHILPLEADRPPVAGTVAEVMTSRVVTLPPDADAAQAAQLMLAHGLRSIPVTMGSVVVGIVTRRDLLRCWRAATRRSAGSLRRCWPRSCRTSRSPLRSPTGW